MKVGILTWYDVINYGSVLQAYALQQMIRRAGHETVILRHDREIPRRSTKGQQIHSFTDLPRWLRDQTPNRRRNRRLERAKECKFLAFREKYLHIGGLFRDVADLDCVVIGSDQIFDVKYFYHPFQFGHSVPCRDISAYAPSFGESRLDDDSMRVHAVEIAAGLSAMRCLSARDHNTRDIIAGLTERTAPIVLDPVLVYDFEQEKNVWNRRHADGPYLLIYAWGGTTVTPAFAENIRRFARRHELQIGSVCHYRSWCDINYADASPIEFFELVRHADLVITNMFHGTCFSILHRKPFYSVTMPHNYNKLEGLLRHLQLESQQVLDMNSIGNMDYPVMNYSAINSRLEERRRMSLYYLSTILTDN